MSIEPAEGNVSPLIISEYFLSVNTLPSRTTPHTHNQILSSIIKRILGGPLGVPKSCTTPHLKLHRLLTSVSELTGSLRDIGRILGRPQRIRSSRDPNTYTFAFSSSFSVETDVFQRENPPNLCTVASGEFFRSV